MACQTPGACIGRGARTVRNERTAIMLPLKAQLDDAGLNRQHVFDLQQLPVDLIAPLCIKDHERQLILLGHAGRRLWERVQAEPLHRDHPIDEYSTRMVKIWIGQALPGARFRFVYPRGLTTGQHVGLQRLGSLAGWHHATPFMVGIDTEWGTWFAYRVAVVTDTCLPPSPKQDGEHPCVRCAAKPCIDACPAKALDSGRLNAHDCHRQRLVRDSPCALDCLARQACPVGTAHRYEQSQIRHSSAASLVVIRKFSTPHSTEP
jgi:epoxyqueuosine reductase